MRGKGVSGWERVGGVGKVIVIQQQGAMGRIPSKEAIIARRSAAAVAHANSRQP